MIGPGPKSLRTQRFLLGSLLAHYGAISIAHGDRVLSHERFEVYRPG